MIHRFAASTARSALEHTRLAITSRPHFYYSMFQRSKQLSKHQTPNEIDGAQSAEGQLTQRILCAKQLDELKAFQQSVFHEHRNCLPLFLCKITKMVSSSNYSSNSQFLRTVQYRLNKNSSELLLKPHQLIEIISFQYTLRLLETVKPLPNKNGFEHRATMIASNFLLNKQFTLTQAVAIMQMLSQLGTVSLTFHMNFTAFLKAEFRKQSSYRSIKIEHLITILNMHFVKNNHTTLDNILFDLTLNFLLSNSEHYLSKLNLIMAVEVLSALLLADLRTSYLSNVSKRNKIIKLLIANVKVELNEESLCFIGLPKTAEIPQNKNQISFAQIVHLFESMDYMKSNKLANGTVRQLCEDFKELFYNIFQKWAETGYQKVKTSLKSFQVGILIKFVFSDQIVPKWILQNQAKKVVLSLIFGQHSGNQKQFIPIINAYLNLSTPSDVIKSALLQIIIHVYSNVNDEIIFWELSQILLQDLQFHRAVLIVESKIRDVRSINKQRLFLQFCLSSILDALQLKYVQNNKQTTHQLKGWIRDNSLQLAVLHKDKRTLLTYISKGQMLNHPSFGQFNLSYWKQCKHLLSIHPNQSERSTSQLMLLNFIFKGICGKDTSVSDGLAIILKSINFHQHNKYKFLVTLYPSDYPMPNGENRRTFPLINPSNFIKAMSIITQHFNIEKYYYLIWDIFIKNYITLPKQIRAASFDLLKDIFMRAFQRQSARKVVILAHLTNYLSDGLIIATNRQLWEICDQAISELVKSQDLAFHYNCFQTIVFNMLSCGILSLSIMEKVISFQYKCSSLLPTTSTIVLLYGYLLQNNKTHSAYLSTQTLEGQNDYVSFRMIGKTSPVDNDTRYEDIEPRRHTNFIRKKPINIGCRLLSILLMSGRSNILNYEAEVLRYIADCHQFSEFMQLANAYTAQSFDESQQQMKSFQGKLKRALLDKLAFFKRQGVMSEENQVRLTLKFM